MDIKAAIFDMDGTLIESLGVREIIWAELGEGSQKARAFA